MRKIRLRAGREEAGKEQAERRLLHTRSRFSKCIDIGTTYVLRPIVNGIVKRSGEEVRSESDLSNIVVGGVVVVLVGCVL